MKTKLIIVNVTATDILNGGRGNCATCPIANAIRRRVKEPEKTYVGGLRLFLEDTGQVLTTVTLPEKAREFIGKFDRGLTVQPFCFAIEIPTNYLK